MQSKPTSGPDHSKFSDQLKSIDRSKLINQLKIDRSKLINRLKIDRSKSIDQSKLIDQ